MSRRHQISSLPDNSVSQGNPLQHWAAGHTLARGAEWVGCGDEISVTESKRVREYSGEDKDKAREREGTRGNFEEKWRDGYRPTHVKRNESRSRTWFGRDPRYPDHCSHSASFLCREFKLDTTTLCP